MRPTISRTVRVLLVFVVTLGVFAERAAAQIPSADGVFYACVRPADDGDQARLVRLVSANEPCRRTETRVHWNVTGPQGPPGTNGTNGTSVTFVDYFSGKQYGCPNGGVVYATGNPPVTAYVCNGTAGKDFTNGTRVAGPCFDNANRYVDCGNGTVTDTFTGLIWLKQADCLGSANWVAANQAAAALKSGDCAGLTDGSSAGDWRLPTKAEWSSTIGKAVALGCKLSSRSDPTLTNDVGTQCLSAGPSSFAGVASDAYWSSSTDENAPAAAGFANLADTAVAGSAKDGTLRVWPVRGGQR
jgi:hypothetical protein